MSGGRSGRTHGLTTLRAALLCAGVVLPAAAALADPPGGEARFAGRPLAAALQDLRAQGLKLVFASNVVTPDLTVETEPRATAPREILDELLAPHGLVARDGPDGTVVVVPLSPPSPAAATPVDAVRAPEPAARFEEELIVRPSRIPLLREESSGGFGLDAGRIRALPHLGDDFFRALPLLPGVTANDLTARFHVRGARRDETQILLDGQELHEAFHLRDYDDALSAVAPDTLGGADLMTGVFPARYGDRASGVLDLTTAEPAGESRWRLGLGILGAQAGGSGSLGGGRGGWLAELRRGSIDLVGRLAGGEDPVWWDGFAKLDLRLGARTGLRVRLLRAGDRLDFEESEGEAHKLYRTRYASAHAWASLETVVTRDLIVETAASTVAIDRDRFGDESEELVRFLIRDQRDSDVRELRQGWTLSAGPRHSLDWGGQWRTLATDFDYTGERRFDDPLARLRHDAGDEETRFAGELEEEHESLYLADRIRIAAPVTLELGARYDRYRESGEGAFGPRAGLAWSPGARGVLRLAWGRYAQSHRPYELQVEDGETSLRPLERSEHRVAGFERSFTAGAAARELALRLELYERRTEDPRARFENLFEAVNTFPEVEPDRVRVAPQRGRARGAELFLRADLGDEVRGWASYSWSSSQDLLDGAWIPNPIDQTHAVDLDLEVPLGASWRLSAAWRYHSGWPTTAIALAEVEDEEGEVELVPVLGPLRGERLSDYHRLDLRLRRSWRFRSADVQFFLDVQNLYDRANLAGYDLEVDEEEGRLVAVEEHWAGLLASLGVTVEF
jgi:outer membrane receptor protein involved in Fe transport